MPRIEGLAAGDAPEHVRKIYAGIEKKYGRMLEPVTVAAHSADIFSAYLSFEGAFQRASALDRKLKELATLKTATLIGCPFCLDIGSAESLEAGVTEEQVRTIHAHETSDAFSDLALLVLDYAAAMSRTPQVVEDELFERCVCVSRTRSWSN